jgi:hypothetical protein
MFKYIIEQEKNLTKIKEDELQSLISNAHEIVGKVKQKSQNEVRYYEGFDAVRRVYDKILKAKEIRSYAHLNKIYEYFPENVKKFAEGCKSGTKLWDFQSFDEITPKMIKDNKHQKNYFYKILPKKFMIDSMDYLVFNDSVAIIDILDENPTAIVIKILY